MIKTEIIGNFVKTYSDIGMKIHGGMPEADYDETYDPIGLGRTYTETDIPVETDEATAEEMIDMLESVL